MLRRQDRTKTSGWMYKMRMKMKMMKILKVDFVLLILSIQ
jgi:hypothetical protein